MKLGSAEINSKASTYLTPTFAKSFRNPGTVREILLIAQLMAFIPGEDFQDWVDSRPPAELCGLYETGMIDDFSLPGGRATDPCQGIVDPMRYLPK